MLEGLPYPEYLRRVPLIVGTHHERMDGQGYPRGLRGEEIPLQGRILAIADVFEALTAKSRPYKKPNTLMEALRILGFMRQEGHIDPDLFQIFLREKVYMSFAEVSLDPEQIDEVSVTDIPGYEGPDKTSKPKAA
jgi:HD-GYP domain-containing protein (c-di-GMP phosphodiesterase class II)